MWTRVWIACANGLSVSLGSAHCKVTVALKFTTKKCIRWNLVTTIADLACAIVANECYWSTVELVLMRNTNEISRNNINTILGWPSQYAVNGNKQKKWNSMCVCECWTKDIISAIFFIYEWEYAICGSQFKHKSENTVLCKRWNQWWSSSIDRCMHEPVCAQISLRPHQYTMPIRS